MNRFSSANPMFSPARVSPYGRPLRMGSPSAMACPFVAYDEEEVEGLGCAKCDEEDELGCAKCKRVRKRLRAGAEISGRHRHMGQATCSVNPAPIGLNCQRTSTGDIVCSNGEVYAKDCPNAPVVNYAGVAQDVAGVPTPPPAPAGGSYSTGTFLDEIPTWGLVAGGLGVAGVLYAIFKK